jgi:class 3 adenylate cyclase
VTTLPGEVERAFLFADLCGYTALTEAHGNRQAAEVVERFLAIATATLRPGASVLERVGDEVVIVAAGAAVAVSTALALRERVVREPLFPVVRAAVHAGPVVERAGGYVGAALNVAARVAALAAPGQIVCTEPVKRAVTLAGVSYRALGPVRLKNIRVPVEIFEVVATAADDARVDPVCRMQVIAGDAVAVEVWEGRSYHFCSEDCAAAFRARPAEYAPG